MENRTDSLRDSLEDQILTGALQPGERLDEVHLAAEFGVSRTPIREALFQLAATGLVEHRPRRGAFVARVGPKRLSEMFEVMAEFEGLAARLAARRATPADIADIRAAHDACATAAPDSNAYYYANEAFHERIRAASANAFLVEEIARLQKRLKAYRRLQLRTRGRIAASFDEHARIVRAIEAGNPDDADAAMRAHVEVQGERFWDLLATVEKDAEAAAARA